MKNSNLLRYKFLNQSIEWSYKENKGNSMNKHQKLPAFFLFLIILFSITTKPVGVMAETETAPSSQDTAGLILSAEEAVLMEASTGRILYEKNSEEPKPPASVTKVMTLLLIFEALDSGKLKLTDEITVSPYAASMGGSQVFLEAGETQTAETMIKCITVSSANDACVAMAEHIAGSEEGFVARMNEKAKELGMEHTTFVNCCGLDVDGHLTCARDIALMSRELTVKHPAIFTYTTIWMDEFTHRTRKGESVFGLSNTNKLLKNYEGCNGLKTGSTSKAKFCLSATATRNGISFIAVVMGCPDSKIRMKDAASLLNYGFANVTLYEDKNPGKKMKPIPIQGGREKTVDFEKPEPFSYILMKGEDSSSIKKKIKIAKDLKAPVKKGETIGEIEYSMNEKAIGAVPIKVAQDIERMSFPYAYKRLCKKLLLNP